MGTKSKKVAAIVESGGGLADVLPRTSEGDYILADPRSLGGDGTYYTGDMSEDMLWSGELEDAKVMTAAELREALEECDGSVVFRERFFAFKVAVQS